MLINLTSEGTWKNHQKNVEKPDKYIFLVKKHNLLKNSLYSAEKISTFIYSHFTKLCEISTVDLTVTTSDKSMVEISQKCGLLRIYELYLNFPYHI